MESFECPKGPAGVSAYLDRVPPFNADSMKRISDQRNANVDISAATDLIRECAGKGAYSASVTHLKLSDRQVEKLKELGFKIETAFESRDSPGTVVISWAY